MFNSKLFDYFIDLGNNTMRNKNPSQKKSKIKIQLII